MEPVCDLSPEVKTPCGCKSPSAGLSRVFCAACLNRNLERACQKTFAALSPVKVGPNGALRGLYPGMPKAALRPADQIFDDDTPRCFHRERMCKVAQPDALAGTGSNASEQSQVKDVSFEEMNRGMAQITTSRSSVQDRGARAETAKSLSADLEERLNDTAEGKKLNLMLLMPKNLTVKIPGTAVVSSSRTENHLLSYQSLSAREPQTRRSAQPSRPRKWMIKPDAAAEAELMMRLLSDSVPVVKAPLVLSLCSVRPLPLSPISPPEDPLWKRRCVPCPKVLRVQLPPPVVVK